MKKFLKYTLLVACSFFISLNIYSQAADTPAENPDNQNNNEATEADDSSVASETDSTSKIPSGYSGATWGSSFDEVKKNIKGKLIYLKQNNIIITKDGEITYYYGFLFEDPEKVGVEKTEDGEEKENTAKFFFTSVEFPYAKMEAIKKKFIDKFGQPTKESIKRNKGAFVWESESTIVIVWVDSYENEPFVKRVTYISKTVSGDLKKYYYKIFNQDQINVMNTLTP